MATPDSRFEQVLPDMEKVFSTLGGTFAGTKLLKGVQHFLKNIKTLKHFCLPSQDNVSTPSSAKLLPQIGQKFTLFSYARPNLLPM